MKKTSPTYHIITKAIAVLLLMAFLIPTGLQAKQLVDFCMMEMAAHHTAASSSDHECCYSGLHEDKADNHHHHDCDLGLICACNIGQSLLSDKEWIPTNNKFEVILFQQGKLAPFFTTDEYILTDQQIRIGEYDPPFYLLYDTYLM